MQAKDSSMPASLAARTHEQHVTVRVRGLTWSPIYSTLVLAGKRLYWLSEAHSSFMPRRSNSVYSTFVTLYTCSHLCNTTRSRHVIVCCQQSMVRACIRLVFLHQWGHDILQ